MGLAAGQTVMLAVGSKTGSRIAVQTAVADGNGEFSFPLKFQAKQSYRLAIAKNPPGGTCSIMTKTVGMITGDARDTVVKCQKHMPEIGNGDPNKCQCYECDGGGLVPQNAYCSGQSIGCSLNQENQGCFGMLNSGITGRCTCANGDFAEPEMYSVSGTIDNMESAGVLVLGCQTLGTLDANQAGLNEQAPGGLATQSFVTTKNGPFTFPYKLTGSQKYQIVVLSNPLDQVCQVVQGGTGIAEQTEDQLRVTCMEANAETTSQQKQQALRDLEYGAKASPEESSTSAGGEFIKWLLILGGFAGFAFLGHKHREQINAALTHDSAGYTKVAVEMNSADNITFPPSESAAPLDTEENASSSKPKGQEDSDTTANVGSYGST